MIVIILMSFKNILGTNKTLKIEIMSRIKKAIFNNFIIN